MSTSTRITTILEPDTFINVIDGGLDMIAESCRLHWQLTDKQKERVIFVLSADLQGRGK